jgi:hypothetical protein
VVSSESNACGGEDDVAYSSASKYINAGEDWTTTLPATVSSAGSYWFKVVVYYGTEKSGASQLFTATSGGSGSGGGGGSGSGGGGGIVTPVEEKPQNTWEYVLSVITKILARLFNIETRTDTLAVNLASLQTRIIGLESRVSKPITVVAPQPVKTSTATKSTTKQQSSASKVKIRLEGK